MVEPLRRWAGPALALAAIFSAFILATALIHSAPADAGPGDNFSVAIVDSGEGEALIGEEITYTLTATGDHTSGAYLYNLSFRSVLPAGTSYISADPPPTEILVGVPGAARTTLIWDNVSDLPAASQSSVSVTVDTNPDFAGGNSGSNTLPVGDTANMQVEAVASLDAFTVPDYNPANGQFTGDFDGSAASSSSLAIIPFRVTKVATDELLRGVHAAGVGGSGSIGVLYNVEIENNPDYPVTAVTLVDTLPPNLEFLGCGFYYALDNTTGGEEWPGSGPVATGACPGPVFTPNSVTTGAGGETIVDWTVGNLAPAQITTVIYQAGIPMFENAPFGGTAPTPASLGQGRNLDNNTGPSTGESDSTAGVDPELLTAGESGVENTAVATGTYGPSGASSSVDDSLIADGEDLALDKTMTGPLRHGGIVTTTLTIETGEYRDLADLVVRDLMPGSLCFLGTYNVDVTGTDWATTDCPGAGSTPATINGVPADVARVRELPDGGNYGFGRMELVWDFADPDNSVLASLPSDGVITIEYRSVVRQYNRVGLAQDLTQPVLAGDIATNEAEVSGPDFAAGGVVPPDPIDPDGGIDGDTASATIENTLGTIDKRVSVKTGPLDNGAGVTPSTCIDDYATITWSDADPTAEPGYGPGDIACFDLGATFPGSVNYEGATIQDLLPAGYVYVAGSATRVDSIDTLPGTAVTEAPDGTLVTFTVGGAGDVGNAGNVFRWVIAATVTDPSLGAALDINANLEKLVHNNNGGLVFQLRDQTAAEWTEPQVRVAKGADTVNAGAPAGPDADGSLSGGSTPTPVAGQDVIGYRVDLWNTGNADALGTEIHDDLPAGFTCADVAAITDGGTCAADLIVWTGLTVPLSVGGGDTTPDNENSAPITLRYDLTVPDSVDPGAVYENVAGVATYFATTNTGTFDYYPEDNIDPANASLENTDAANDSGFVETDVVTVTVVQQSGIAETGNAANAAPAATDDEATIGEIVEYAVTVTIPEGTSIYDAVITSPLPAGVNWFTGDGLFQGAVTDLQPTVTSPSGDAGLLTGTISENAGVATYALPSPYMNPGGSAPDVLTFTFYGIVDDVPGNDSATPTSLTTDATFDWLTAAGTDPDPVDSNTVTSEIVEPNPAIDKGHTTPIGTEVSSGDFITYQLTLTNDSAPGNVSIANDSQIVDTVPAGVTPVGAGGVPVAGDGDLVPSAGVTPVDAFDGVWSETNHTITWTNVEWVELDALDPDETLVFTYDAEVDNPAVSSGVLTNTADLTAYSLDQDLTPTADPNSGLARSYASSDDDTLSLPLATLTKDIEPFTGGDPADDRATFAVGEPVDYQLSMFAPNGTVIYDATLFDALPTGLDFDSFGTITIDPNCTIFDSVTGTPAGPLTPGEIETFHPVSGDATLVGWFVGDLYGAGDCTIDLEYTAHVNDSTVASDPVTNNAELLWNATSMVADQAPAVLEPGFDTPTSASWDLATDPAAETLTVVEPVLAIDQDVTTASGGSLIDPGCDTTPGNNDDVTDDPDGLPADGCDVQPGSELTQTITVTNSGTGDAFDTTVVVTVPVGLTPLDGPAGTPVDTTGQTITGPGGAVGTWDETARTITWEIPGPIAPAGGTATLDYNVVVDPSDTLDQAQDLSTTVDVPTYFGLAQADRTTIVTDNPANDDIVTYGNDPTAIRGPVTTDTTTVEVHFPELAIVKGPGTGQDITDVRLDTPFTWDLTVTNTNGVASAYEVDIVDVLPEGWTYDAGSALVTTPYGSGVPIDPTCAADAGVCADAAALNVETLTWSDVVAGPTEPLAPGDEITVTFTATPQALALTSTQAVGEAHTGYDGGAGYTHTNSASVAGEDATGSSSCCDPDGPGGLEPLAYGDADDSGVHIARSDIEVAKSIIPVESDGDPDNGPYWFGAWVNYTVTVTNLGPDGATGVQISDVLDPAGLAFDSIVTIDQGTFDETTNIWDIGSMTNGAVMDLTLRTRLVGLGPVVNTAQNSAGDQYDSDSTPGNDVAAEDDQSSVTIEVVPTSLGDFVWLDLNGDGVQDSGEPGIPDVDLLLTWVDPVTGAPGSYTVTTAADGSYGVPAAAGLPTNTDITVTVDSAATNLAGLAPSFDRDGTLDNAATEQVTPADTTLPDGSFADLAFDFGYTPDGTQSIGDALWWDQDNSGDATDGAGEAPLANIGVDATWAGWDDTLGTADDLSFSTTTDGAGNYLFDTLPPGQYEVAVDTAALPAGLDVATYDLDGLTTADVATIDLDPGEVHADVDFSYTGPGSLGDTVWFDHDGNGSIDVGEPGLGGVDVTATWAGPDGILGTADDVSMTTTTAADGTYLFENLPYGDFTITIDSTTLPAGLTPTFDPDGIATPDSTVTNLSSATPDDLRADFGYAGVGSVGDVVFFDVDGVEADGVADSGDAAIVGATVTVEWAGADGVSGTADDFVASTVTDGTGTYGVSGLPFGSVSVTVDPTSLPPGLQTPTFDADGTGTPHASVVVLDAVTPDNSDQDFAYTGSGVGIIGDRVYFDQGNDGAEDPGDVGFSGVNVSLTWFGPDGLVGGGDDVVQTTVTDATGAYLFDNLPDGAYDVAVDPATLPAGLVPSGDADGTATPNVSSVTVSPTAPSNLDQDFGYSGVGSIGDFVWLDVDASGTATADADEPGIPAVDLTITWTNPQGDDVAIPVTTASDGSYLVPNLPHGDFVVAVDPSTLPGGVTATFDADGAATPDEAAVTLDAVGPDNTDQDFAYAGVGSLGDTVWFDQDADGALDPVGSGIFDGQDQPIAAVDLSVVWGGFDGVIGDDPATVGIDEAADDLVYAAATDANGEWLVENLPHGPYTVTVDPTTLPAGTDVATFDADGVATANTTVVTLDDVAPVNLDQDFSYTGSGSVGDTVWFDYDGDGVVDPGEPGLAGVTVTITFVGPAGTPVTVTTVTDTDGAYRFDNLPHDVPLTITTDPSTLPTGFVEAWDADGVGTPHESTTTLSTTAPTDFTQNFGYYGSGSIGDLVWYDLDNSATPDVDPGEPGIPNVSISITWTNPTGGPDLDITETTDDSGVFVAGRLPHGDYVVTVDDTTLPAGLISTYDLDGAATLHTAAVTLADPSMTRLDVDFAYTGQSSIGDTIWRDEDGDGSVGPTETGIEGVAVTISYTDPVSGLLLSLSTSTGPDGTYLFENLPAGDYLVTVDPATLPAGYVPTFDADGVDSPDSNLVVLGPAEAQLASDFGYRPEADLVVTKSRLGDVTVGVENFWTIGVTNAGPAPAMAPVTVTDTLPDHSTFVRTTSTTWRCDSSGATVTCTLIDPATGSDADLAAGDLAELDLAVQVDAAAATEVTNSARAQSPTVDPDPTNDVATSTAAAPLALLGVETAIDGPLTAGEDAVFAITVTNHGPSTTQGDSSVTFDLPVGLSPEDIVGGPGVTCAVDGQTVTCTRTTPLAPGETWNIEVTAAVSASAAGQSLTTTARVSGGNAVNGEQIPAEVMAEIYESLADPGDPLRAELGIAADAFVSASATQTGTVVAPPPVLAFTGSDLFWIVLLGFLLMVTGAFSLFLSGVDRETSRAA